MKGLSLLFFLSSIFVTNIYSQKLKPVVVKKLDGNTYSKEEYSILKRGKDKGKRHGEYVYSKFAKEIIGVYHLGLKDGEWKYDQSSNQFSEFYTKGHLDSMRGIKDGLELRIHFDKVGDTSYSQQSKPHPSYNDVTINFKENGITFEKLNDTTYYFYSSGKTLVGKTIRGKKVGKWIWNTNTLNAITCYNEGLPVGTHTSFYPNGKTMSIKSFDSFGLKDGPNLILYENGDTAYFQILVNGSEEEPNETIYPNNGKQDIYINWPKPAKFIGGDERLQLFIATNIKYPPSAAKEGKQGTVQVVFDVNTLGEVENLETPGNQDPFLKFEAMRVVKLTSYCWIPATQNGFPVKMRFRIPINFSL